MLEEVEEIEELLWYEKYIFSNFLEGKIQEVLVVLGYLLLAIFVLLTAISSRRASYERTCKFMFVGISSFLLVFIGIFKIYIFLILNLFSIFGARKLTNHCYLHYIKYRKLGINNGQAYVKMQADKIEVEITEEDRKNSKLIGYLPCILIYIGYVILFFGLLELSKIFNFPFYYYQSSLDV